MDKQRIYICIAIVLFFAAVGALAYNYLEIYPRKRHVFPSREVSSNSYYAMEQWLKQTGHNVRTEEYFYSDMLKTTNEKVVMLLSGTSYRHDAEEIIAWIEQGGFFVVSIDHNNGENEHLFEFLSGFGITVEYNQPDLTSPREESEDEESEPELQVDFQSRIAFLANEEDNIFVMKDNTGTIRLVEIPVGNGSLTVIGMPIFMYNRNLRKEANAALAWKLTGERADEDNKGILFIRSQNRRAQNSMLGAILRRGNIVPVVISSIILIFTGFWMAVPVFGLVSVEKQKTSRPIRDRFTAEIRFLKKYQALNHYLHVYEREQKHENLQRQNTENETIYNYKELINQYRRIFDGTTKS